MTYNCIREGMNLEMIIRESLGASPNDINKSLKRLIRQGKITSTQYEQLLHSSDSYNPRLEKEYYISHMLDGDWKFNHQGIQNIIEVINAKSNSLKGKKIAFFGTPTLYKECIIQDIGDRRLLVDKNANQYKRFILSDRDSVVNIDMLSNTVLDLVNEEFDVIVMDPPWYFDMFLRFILEARKVLKQGGLIYCAYPQNYTRPTIQEEYKELITELRNFNIEMKARYKQIVSYSTPLFEEYVLNHEGITLRDRNWRYADLLCFEYSKKNIGNETCCVDYSEPEWNEVWVCNVCFKFRRRGERQVQANILESPFEDALLPSFSARDYKSELESVNLWSSSNHVYCCGDLDVFLEIVSCLSCCANYIDKDRILEHIKANSQYEHCTLKRYVDQVVDVISSEIEIAKRWIASFNMNKSFFVSDYDGTIRNGEYTEENVRRLREIAKMLNTGLIICSGRKYDYLSKMMRNMNVPVDYFICSNGAEIYDKNGYCIDMRPLNRSDVQLLQFMLDEEHKVSKVTKPSYDSKWYDLLWIIYQQGSEKNTYSKLKQYLNCFKDDDKILVSAKEASKDQAIARLSEYGVRTIKYIGDSESDNVAAKQYGGVLLRNMSGAKRAATFRSFCDRFILERQLLDSLLSNGYIAEYQEILNKRNFHLAIFTEPYFSYIKSGEKTMESRFSTNRIAPYAKVNKGDYIFMKRSSGKVEGFFKAAEVFEYCLDKSTFACIKDQYGEQLCVTEAFWSEKMGARYATIIRISEYGELSPFDVLKKDMLGWVSL